ITLGYKVGTDQDPRGRQGLSQVLSEIGFTAPAGDIPERTIKEMDSIRPLGWGFPVSRRVTLFTEVASVDQFPGGLKQVATRMRGVTVTRENLQRAVRAVQTEMGEQLFGPPEISLYYQVREVALGHSDDDILARASGKEIAGLSVREVQDAIKRLYV